MVKAILPEKWLPSGLNLERIKKSFQNFKITEQFRKIFQGDELFRSKTEISLCLNIGNYYLKGLFLKGDDVFDYSLERNEDLAKTLQKILAEKKISPQRVKVSVKNPSCLVRYFSFPKMEKKRLEAALFYELNKHIPFSPEEVYFDYYILQNASPQEFSILLAAAKKEFIDHISEVFKNLGLNIIEINLDSICLLNLFLNNYNGNKDSNCCILDIGSSFSVMSIVHKGIPFLTRDVKFSTKDIVAIVARARDAQPQEVEEHLAQSPHAADFLEFMQGSISSFCKEVKSSFDYFEVNQGERVEKLYLTGGLTSVKDIENIFSEALDIDTEILASTPISLAKLNAPFLDERFNSLRNNFSVAFGLTL